MLMTQEQLSKVAATNTETLLRFSAISLNGLERLVKIQLEASKQNFEDGIKAARELSSVKTPQEGAQRLNQLASSTLEKTVNTSRTVYEAIALTQGELSKLAEEILSSGNKNFLSLVEQAGKNAPSGSEPAVNAIKSSVAATAAMMDSMTKAAQQVAEFASTSVKTATSATTEAVKQAQTASSKK